jgi:hypothetical protein
VVVEWPESKPAGWQTGLAAKERGGLTRAGGSTAVQTKQRGAVVVEQRSSRGRRQGGRGSSRHRFGAQGGVREFRVGPEWQFAVAQRQ